MISFKDGFKRARKELKLTQEEFATKYNYSLSTVKKWEQGKAVPEVKTLEHLCEVFQCDLSYLFYQIDLTNHDLQFIHDATGLSQEAIEMLIQSKEVSEKQDRDIFAVVDYLIRRSFLYSCAECICESIKTNVALEQIQDSLQQRRLSDIVGAAPEYNKWRTLKMLELYYDLALNNCKKVLAADVKSIDDNVTEFLIEQKDSLKAFVESIEAIEKEKQCKSTLTATFSSEGEKNG